MTDRIKPFLGTWLLDVDESEFDQGALPRAGSCRIEERFGLISFKVAMTEATGETVKAEFTGVPDGRETPLIESGLADRLVLYFADDRTLVSEARRQGATLMTARRTLSEDGQILTIEQTVQVPGQGPVSNSAVYRRAQ